MNLVYLCALDANDPQKVREYMVLAEVQIDDLVKMHGLDVSKAEG